MQINDNDYRQLQNSIKNISDRVDGVVTRIDKIDTTVSAIKKNVDTDTKRLDKIINIQATRVIKKEGVITKFLGSTQAAMLMLIAAIIFVIVGLFFMGAIKFG